LKDYDDNSRRMRAIKAQDTNPLEPEAPTRTRRPSSSRYRYFLPIIAAVLTMAMSSISPAARAQVPPLSNSTVPSATLKPSVRYWLGKSPTYKFSLPTLPTAAQLPKTSADDQAAVLAAEVEGGGYQSLPALLAALSASGITVQAANGTPPRPASAPGQGIVLDQGQVEVIDLLAKNDVLVPLTGFADSLGAAIPALKSAPVAADILDGLRADAESQQPQVRFFARFVIALVHNSGYDPSNIFTDGDPAAVTIDGVAMDLITLRLAADLNGLGATGQPASGQSAMEQPESEVASSGPCSMDETASQIMDASANASSIGYDKLVDYLVEHQVAVPGFLKGSLHEWVNVLLALAKVYAYVAATKVDLTVTPDPPLVRTKSPYTPGDKTVLTAHQFVDISQAQQTVNCFRFMLNMVGLDLSVPNSGNVAGAQVNFECWQGCSTGYVTRGTYARGFVEFTRADPSDPRTGDPVHQRTNEEGEASIGVEGVKQPYKVPESASPVKEMAEFVARVQLKVPSMAQDLIDAIPGASLGLATIVNFSLETLLRSNLIKYGVLWLPVIDWSDAYAGTFSGVDESSGIQYAWQGTAAFSAGPDVTVSEGFTLSSATISVQLSGSYAGCSYSGSGAISYGGPTAETELVGSSLLALDIPSKGDYSIDLQAEGGQAGFVRPIRGTATCTDNGQTTTNPTTFGLPFWLDTGTQKLSGNDFTTLSGTYSGSGFAPLEKVVYKWDFHATGSGPTGSR
jgi:hypothetical protein